jgi:hypothetical protein
MTYPAPTDGLPDPARLHQDDLSGSLGLLAVSSSLRRELGLEDKLPHYITLAKLSARSQVLEMPTPWFAPLGKRPWLAPKRRRQRPWMRPRWRPPAPAPIFNPAGVDSGASGSRFRHCPLRQSAADEFADGLGPTNDKGQARSLIAKAQEVARPDTLYADAGYDAEWIHAQCREEWGGDAIKPARHRADGKRNGIWRSGMSKNYLRRMEYGRRWAAETFFSGWKRTMGSMLTLRRPEQLLKEVAFRVWAYILTR